MQEWVSETLPYSIILKLEGGDFLFEIEKKSFGNSRRKDEGYTLCLQALIYERYKVHMRALQSKRYHQGKLVPFTVK